MNNNTISVYTSRELRLILEYPVSPCKRQAERVAQRFREKESSYA